MSELGQMLRDKRIASKLTQRELSEMTGIAVPNISMYESGDKGMSTYTYNLLSAAIDKIIVLKINELKKMTRKK